ncbi:sugar phosphate isomerase/epimerase family protein [Adhaeretor mobilis]|nr:AP endonuclease [Adhaeretor mobilis]
MPTRLLTIVLLLASCPFVFFQMAYAEPNVERDVNLYAKDNLVAWCIVPYDNQDRTPAERTQMLQELGFRSLAWDWRHEHLSLLDSEILLLRKARIKLKAVWCWIDGRSKSGLGEANEQVLASLERTGTKTEIWVSFAAPFFAGLSDEEKVAKGAEMVAALRKKTKAIGCRVSLYNHGDWFGEPRNMVKVLRYLKVGDVGLVYNFHHAHSQLKDYQSNLALMMPYLRTVNLNGMRSEGPKIIRLGSGDLEGTMMRQLKEAGFKGHIGILGHVEEADVKDVLTENLSGMKKLLRRMGEAEALSTY